MEDDSRNWTQDRKRLLANLLHPKQRDKIAQHDAEIDWQRVADLARAPRAVPVPITGGHDGVDAVIANGLLVENTVPQGSNWDGQSGLLVDEKTFNDLLNGRDKAPVQTP
jgi:hypothetical protein